MDSLQDGQWQVLELVASGASLSEILSSIVGLIEAQATQMLCSILLFDEEHQTLHHGAACRLPEAYVRALEGLRIGPHVGSCGAAASLRERVVVEDVITHPNWTDYRALAGEYGLRACWSTPILSPTRELLGTFVMYYREPRGPGPREIAWVTLATHLAAIAIVRDRSERALRISETRAKHLARLHSVSSSVNEAIVRMRDVQELYAFACRIAVEKEFAELAWIGMYDAEADCVLPVARFGADSGYIDTLVLRLHDPEITRGPAAMAILTKAPSVCNDVAADPTFFWKNAATARGLRACAAFPLGGVARSAGVLVYYSSNPGFFGAEETRALSALADDISFAVAAIENERERVQAEAALRENEERLRILNDLGDAVRSASDPDDVLRLAVEILGRSLGVTRCVYAIVEPERDRCVVPYEYLDGGESVVGEYRLSQLGPLFGGALRGEATPIVICDTARTPLGPETAAAFGTVSIHALVCCALHRQGSLRAMMAVHQATPRVWTASEVATLQEGVERCWSALEQRTVETKLRQSEALLRIAGRAARLGGWSIDLPDRRLTWSDEVCVLHEVPIGTTPTVEEAFASFAPEHQGTITRSLERCAGDGTPFDHELELITAKQRRIWVRVIGHAERAADGSVVRLQGAIQDVGDRRALEEQLRQAQKMEALGQLAGGVAHDFNNVLTVILSYADLLVSDPSLVASLREDVEQMRTAGLRGAGLTRQLLAFSRQQVVAFQALDLNAIVEESEKLLRRLLGESIDLETITARDLASVNADVGQMEQVVMNLALNARDAMPDGGKLLIETSNVVLDDEQTRALVGLTPGAYVRLTVSDNGLGMDEETRARIFEPFFTTKEKGKGTGLGLSTVFGIVSQGGGGVEVTSEPGRGSTFRVYLPIAPGGVEVTTIEPPSLEAGRGDETILLVEDDDQVRTLSRDVLLRSGYVVLEASNGRDALSLSERHDARIDLLLTDVVMPHMSGRHLAERVNAQRPDTKVLFMSGYTDDAILHHGVFAAGIAYLAKPLTPAALRRKVREVLSR